MRLGGREPDVIKVGYETAWPEKRMNLLVIRKDMRLGGREPDELCGDERV